MRLMPTKAVAFRPQNQVQQEFGMERGDTMKHQEAHCNLLGGNVGHFAILGAGKQIGPDPTSQSSEPRRCKRMCRNLFCTVLAEHVIDLCRVTFLDPTNTEPPPPFQIPLQVFVGRSKSVPSKLNLSNCKITSVHFLNPVPQKLISRYFRGVLDDVGCMFIVVPYMSQVLEKFWWLMGVIL